MGLLLDFQNPVFEEVLQVYLVLENPQLDFLGDSPDLLRPYKSESFADDPMVLFGEVLYIAEIGLFIRASFLPDVADHPANRGSIDVAKLFLDELHFVLFVPVLELATESINLLFIGNLIDDVILLLLLQLGFELPSPLGHVVISLELLLKLLLQLLYRGLLITDIILELFHLLNQLYLVFALLLQHNHFILLTLLPQHQVLQLLIVTLNWMFLEHYLLLL